MPAIAATTRRSKYKFKVFTGQMLMDDAPRSYQP
jgi:hypothetical protein